MFRKVLVANRGAVVARVIRALHEMGIGAVCVYSEADAALPYLAEADEKFLLGPAPPHESYLDQDAILRVLAQCGADGVHPGYGFLSESAAFARAVNAAGATFIGPAARWIEAMGHKTEARELMARNGMPIGAGSGVLAAAPEAVLAEAQRIGFPVLVKPAGGGGGIGMMPAHDADTLVHAVERAASMAQRSFGSAQLYLEKLVDRPRHIEFQVLADRHGGVRHLFERDCSLQRRHQKIIEESPAPNVPVALIEEHAGRIVDVLTVLGYDNIGTVEMLMSPDGEFSFLEMNTRLQVEHAVTEAVTGIDLVVAQLRAAAGERLDDFLPKELQRHGHAIEARIYAEDPRTFFPSPGRLEIFRPPTALGLRVETGYGEGSVVTPFYDPMLAKLIAHADTRGAAIALLSEGLRHFAVAGLKTNIPFLLAALASDEFRSGDVHTGLAEMLKRQAVSRKAS
jgi:acetyl-CoA carboxylase, biotin carboxylase subunit